jgi:ubiquinone/menaquinone biosynthesis C-methylase UbiE
VEDPEALLREVHRLLKPDGLLLMDPGHSRLRPALARVERMGRFELLELAGHRMLLRRRPIGDRGPGSG